MDHHPDFFGGALNDKLVHETGGLSGAVVQVEGRKSTRGMKEEEEMKHGNVSFPGRMRVEKRTVFVQRCWLSISGEGVVQQV